MNSSRLFFLACLLAMLSCKNKPVENSGKDSAKVPPVAEVKNVDEDSLAEVDCYGAFFKESAVIDSSITLITGEGKKYTLPRFVEEEGLEREYLTITHKDFDKDSVPELWIRHFTMGAHCCDVWYVFLKQSNGLYKQSATLSAGNVCVDDSIFTFTFDEALGYFKSCYACGFDDSAKGFVMMREISLRFRKGKFEVIPYSAKDEEQLIKNLQVLQAEGVGTIDEDNMDRGLRKEFAMNIAVYYYNHQKDMKAAKALFDKYYTFKDARAIWKELAEYLKDIKEYNGI